MKIITIFALLASFITPCLMAMDYPLSQKAVQTDFSSTIQNSVPAGQIVAAAKSLEKIKCKTCNVSFFPDYLDYLKHHIYAFHVASKCTDCNINFIEPEDFTDHLRKYHKKDVQIPQHLSLAERKELNVKIAKHLPEMKFECPLCCDLYPTEEMLNAHYAHAHGAKATSKEIQYDPESLEDVELLREFADSIAEVIEDDSEAKVGKSDSKETLTITSHSALQYYQCQFPECSDQSNANSPLRKHILHHHVKIKPYACPFFNCGKHFYKLSQTEDHTAKDHSHEAPLPISKVSEETIQKMDKEIDKYMPELPFKCGKCSCSFINQRSLISHANIAHPTRPRLQAQETRMRPASNKRPLTNATALPEGADQSLKSSFQVQPKTRKFTFINKQEKSGV